MKDAMNLLGVKEDLILDATGNGIITSEQELGPDFWNNLDQAKEDFSFRHNGLTAVASIPESVVNRWIREGFNFWSAPANEIIRKLRIDNCDKFIISGDKTFDR